MAACGSPARLNSKVLEEIHKDRSEVHPEKYVPVLKSGLAATKLNFARVTLTETYADSGEVAQIRETKERE